MTASNGNSAAADNLPRSYGYSRGWIALIVLLAGGVVGLNSAMFVLVQHNLRDIEARETEAQRRFVAVEAREAHRESLVGQIKDLEAKKSTAERQAEDARNGAADASRIKNERDRLFRDFNSAKNEYATIQAQLAGAKSQIEALKSEEGLLNNAIKNARGQIEGAREQIVVGEKRRDELQTSLAQLESRRLAAAKLVEDAEKQAPEAQKIIAERDRLVSEVQAAKLEITRLQARRREIAVDEEAGKRASAARVEAEKSQAKAEDDNRNIQQRLNRANSELAALEKRRDAIKVEESAVVSAEKMRLEAEKELAKVQSDLGLARRQLLEAQADITKLEKSRAGRASDEAELTRASSDRALVEQALAKVRGELTSEQRRLSLVQGELERLEKLKSSTLADENAARQAEVARKEAERTRLAEENELAKIRSEFQYQIAALTIRKQALINQYTVLENVCKP